MINKILVGNIGNFPVFIEKHKWSCGWYWSFGHLSTQTSSFNIKSMLPNQSNQDKIVFKNDDTLQLAPKYAGKGWYIMEMFNRARILQEYAELRHLGYGGISELKYELKDKKEADKINSALKEILDEVWTQLEKE